MRQNTGIDRLVGNETLILGAIRGVGDYGKVAPASPFARQSSGVGPSMSDMSTAPGPSTTPGQSVPVTRSIRNGEVVKSTETVS
jgi:hypothetical protein